MDTTKKVIQKEVMQSRLPYKAALKNDILNGVIV